MSSGRERVARFVRRWTKTGKRRSSPNGIVSEEAGSPRDFDTESTARLARTIQAEIVPRLMLAHRDGTEFPSGDLAYSATPPTHEEVAELARLIVANDPALGREYIEAMRVKGMPVETVFVALLAPAARLLGRRWAEDECTFTDVTIGLSRLHRIVDELASSFYREGGFGALPGPRAALVEVPGEQHTFGVHMLREFFRRDGWDVWGASSTSPNELINLVQDEWINLVGLSMSDPSQATTAADLIREIRDSSLNPGLFIMVGGPCVLEDSEMAKRTGADAAPIDAKEALALAREHFDQMGSSRERH